MRPALALVAWASWLAVAPLAAGEDPAGLLAASDPFARAPDAGRLLIEVDRGRGGETMPLEIWRSGDARALIRFLAPRERGKYLVRHDEDLYFLSPGSRRPVRLTAAMAPPGAELFDQLLRLDLARDYRIVVRNEVADQVSFDLEARPGREVPPRVRWVVDAPRRRPLRAELLDARGRPLEIVEFRSWRGSGIEPESLRVTDLLRGGAQVEIRVLEVERRPVPEALFALDLSGEQARSELPPPVAPAER